MAVFLNQSGNQVFTGTTGVYDQVDYQGTISDYTFALNTDGSITVEHPTLGTDTLNNIDGFWFLGESSWYSLEDALSISPPVDNGPVVTGTTGDDVLIGSQLDNFFIGSEGNDTIDGNGGAYNQVNYIGSLSDYILQQNADGSVSVYNTVLGTDTLSDIDGFWFSGEESWYSLADAIEIAGGVIPTDGDDFAGNATTTGTIAIDGEAATGTLEEFGDRDWFAFEAVPGETYRFDLNGPGAASLNVFDANGNVLAAPSNSGPPATAPSSEAIFFTPETAGEFFVSVNSNINRIGSGPTGTYSVTATTVVDDFGDTTATAGNLIIDGPAITGSIDSPGDQDMFAIDVIAGQGIRIETDSTLAFIPRLLDEAGNVIGTSVGGNFEFTATETQTVYFLARSINATSQTNTDEVGEYQVSVTQTIAPPPVDDFADNATTTGAIEIDADAATGNIETRGDDDWFAIDGVPGQSVRFSLDAASSLIGLRIYDVDGNQLETSVIAGPTGAPGSGDVFFTIPDEGEYFVAAAGLSFRGGAGRGEYSITAETIIDDFGNTIATADSLEVNGATINGALNQPGDIDVFEINVQAGQELQFDFSRDGFFGAIYLMDAEGNVLQAPGFGSMEYSAEEDATLYLSVRGLGGSPYTLDDDWGDYTLSVTDNSTPETFIGTADDDTLIGDAGDNTMNGRGGDDIINGNAGDDNILGGAGSDTIRGGDGNDRILGEFNDQDNITTESEDDFLFGEAGNDSISGQRGDDLIDGGDGDDFLYGGFGEDSLLGRDGADNMFGGGDDDFLNGGRGNDVIEGNAGNDNILGGSGSDTIRGGAGNDRILGEFNDLDNQSSESEDDFLYGEAGNDSISGQRGDDLIDGGTGNDFLYGGSGNDTIIGGGGDDFLSAGSGDGVMTGGTGADTFEFLQQDPSFDTTAQITDFNGAQGDTIDISSFGLANFGELQALMTQVGTGVSIDFGGGRVLTLQNTNIDSLTAEDFGLDDTPAEPFIEGTDGDDILVGSNINNVFFGGSGNDIIDGNGGDYNQADYDGFISDFNIFANEDGSYTVSHANGTDTLRDIDGFWFGGEGAWYSIEDAVEMTGDDELLL